MQTEILYIVSTGITASKRHNFLQHAEETFCFKEAIVFCGENIVDEISLQLKPNTSLVTISNPFHGTDDYLSTLRKLFKQVRIILKKCAKSGNTIEEILVNTSGGTEKMSCIMHDLIEIMKHYDLAPVITHIWCGVDGYTPVYTTKPKIILEDIFAYTVKIAGDPEEKQNKITEDVPPEILCKKKKESPSRQKRNEFRKEVQILEKEGWGGWLQAVLLRAVRKILHYW
ncbi:MAG: hypothetical protein WC511_02235 [Candidatus Pacearchaeota archaeon]